MARRSVGIHGLRFTEKYKRGDEIEISPHDIDGEDLIVIFHEWCQKNIGNHLNNPKTTKLCHILSAELFSPRAVLVNLAVGSYGEEGPIVNTETFEESYSITEDEAPMAGARVLLLVSPNESKYATFFTEFCIRGSGGSDLFRSFSHYFSKYSDTARMRREQLYSGDDWQEGSRLTEVEVTCMRSPKDAFDPIDTIGGVLSYSFRSTRGNFLSRTAYRMIKQEPKLASKLIGVDVPDDAKVSFTVKDENGKVRTFDVNDPDSEKFGYREVLNSNGEEKLSDNDFVSKCSEIAARLLGLIGEEWDSSWIKAE